MKTQASPRRKEREKPLALCAACGRERPCYHARSERPLCRSCYRRENIGRWKIARWEPPVAVCCVCQQGPAWFARTDRPLCWRCHRQQQPQRKRAAAVEAACQRCGRERPCLRTARGELVCGTCRRGDYHRDWTAPTVHCVVCGRDSPGVGAGSDRPVCRSCRRRELARQREQPYRRPLAVCSGCGRERPCYHAAGPRPLCHSCRYRGWKPRVDLCRVCGRDRPCHHANTERAICRSCHAARRERHERCLACGQLRRVHRRVDGRPECAGCAKQRMRKRIHCPDCGGTLRPAASDPSRCERCAGEAVLHECRSCRAQANNYDQGRCPACGLRERLLALRAESDPAALARLEPYLAALAVAPNPWATVRWMQASPSYRTLRWLATGALELSHEALDDVGGRSSDHLRGALVAHAVLPRRGEQAASFERAATRLLARLPECEDRTGLRAYATWRLHHHLQRRERRGQTTRGSARHELRRLRAAVGLTLWAHEQGHTLSTLCQHDLDRWLANGPGERRRVADFLAWAANADSMTPLAIPARAPRRHTDQLGEQARLALVRRLLDDDTLDPRDRVGGLLVLLLAQPASRLLMLTTSHVTTRDGRVTIRLGVEPLELPERIGLAVAALARERATAQPAAPHDSPWLFPGRRADAPLSEQQFSRRLRRLGIPTLPARTGALLSLAASLPPAILADLLGVSEGSAANWSRLAAGDWAAYAARGPDRYQPPTSAHQPAHDDLS